jgi:hypothetical protein
MPGHKAAMEHELAEQYAGGHAPVTQDAVPRSKT